MIGADAGGESGALIGRWGPRSLTHGLRSEAWVAEAGGGNGGELGRSLAQRRPPAPARWPMVVWQGLLKGSVTRELLPGAPADSGECGRWDPAVAAVGEDDLCPLVSCQANRDFRAAGEWVGEAAG